MKCPQCGTALQAGERDEIIRCQDREVVLRSLKGDFCPACGEGVLSPASYREFTRVQSALVEAVSNPAGDEIRQARSRLKLSQKELGGLLGITALAISRYERQETRPPGPVLRLVRLLLNHPELKDEIARFG